MDASAVVAMHDRHDRVQADAERVLRDEPGALVLPAPVTAEIDYLLARRGGPRARLPFLDDLVAGRYAVECLRPEEYATVVELERRYAALAPGLADLSIVVLAHRFGTQRVATFDERRFRALAPLEDGAFVVLPADS